MEVAKEYVINDPEDLIPCPYESAHMIRAKRMPYHIAKCRKNHIGSMDMTRCPYNAAHEVYSAELRYHMAVCEDKHRLQAKIAQEFSGDAEVRGCTETPHYRPLNIWGDSWEDETAVESCFTSGRVTLKEPELREPENLAQEPEEEKPQLTDAEKQGLTGRQLQMLYLKKQAELRQAKEAALRKPVEEKLRVPRQPSQSLAIHRQQQIKQKPDIYQQALKDQQERALALGRGRGLLLGAGRGLLSNAAIQPPSVGSVNGHSAASTTNSLYPGAQFQRLAGRGWGDANSAVNGPGTVRTPGAGNVNIRTPANLANFPGAFGRGVGGVQGVMNAGPPSDFGAKRGGLYPQGNGDGMFGGIGRGATTHPFLQGQGYSGAGGSSQVNGGYGGRQQETAEQVGSLPYGMPPVQYMSSSSETEEEQFQTPPSWVGGGYSGDLDPSPSISSSSGASMTLNQQAARSASATSVMSTPQVVGSWAEEMENTFPIPTAVPSSDSLSSDSDFQDPCRTDTIAGATKELRKIKKKLRQIDEIEMKMRQGLTLDTDSEAKYKSKAVLITQAAQLQQRFGLS